MSTPNYLLLGLMFHAKLLVGQTITLKEKKEIDVSTKEELDNNEISVDGSLNESLWSFTPWYGNFFQRDPDEGKAPSEETTFAITHDDKYLYVGVRCYDRNPELIEQRSSRRDGFEGDWVEVSFDSYHDLRNAFSFTLTAAGVKGDKFISENGQIEDESWNPVWYGNTAIDSLGWTAEMKIPLSQLRFKKANQQTWGLQVIRRLFREEERSVWQRIPLDVAGWVSEYGELKFNSSLKSQHQLEIQPYVVGSLNTYELEASNPYRSEIGKGLSAGVDGKVGLTNDLTLDFTINPDFGQVEADPAAIALDGFQIFFREQRPFFIENKNIFNYPISISQTGDTFEDDNIFYSRRIGRNPQLRAKTSEGEYLQKEDHTTILGALKFSGKTKNGWSIGILESVTSSEFTKISDGTTEREQLSEPKTNYLVSRIQKDMNQRNTFLGAIFTSTIRFGELDNTLLNRSAITGGVDFKHQWKNRSWFVSANSVGSWIKGSQKSIFINPNIDQSSLSAIRCSTSEIRFQQDSVARQWRGCENWKVWKW